MLRFIAQFINQIVTALVIMFVIATGTICYAIYHYSLDLPDYRQLAEYNPATVTRLYASDGKLLEEYATEHRLFVPITAIPRPLINAFLAAEDKNFYDHPGIDFLSIMRAVAQNLLNFGHNKSLVGGSTITQQVVKNFLLTNEKSISRKVKEAILSFRISQVYSKERILELYLNQIYLGGGSYGVASAAINYFNKSIDELTIEEAAFIAALPKAPSNYDPAKHYEKAKIRRDWVIGRMAAAGFITDIQEQEAIAKPILLRKRDITEIAKAEFFAESVRREIAQQYGSKTLYEGGLVVRTCLDPHLQKLAEDAFKKGLVRYDQKRGYRGPLTHLPNLQDWLKETKAIAKQYDLSPWRIATILKVAKDHVIIGLEDGNKANLSMIDLAWTKYNFKSPSEILHIGDIIPVEEFTKEQKISYSLRQIPEVSGGFIVMDPHTGRVLAMMGGFSYQKSEFNRAMQAKRQPGSVYKTFVYLDALENGFSPSSIIVDGPIELNQGAGLPTWKPKNYSGDFLGPTTLRRGLEKSRNTMTVRLAEMLGIKSLMEVTQRFGINKEPQRNFSLALGAAETTLIDMTNAYAMLINGGKKVTPALIERIQDRNGNTIYKRDQSQCVGCEVTSESDMASIIAPEILDQRQSVTDPRTAYQMVSILEGAIQRGTGGMARSLGKTIGGKTGTTNDSNDAWFIGFTPDLLVGTYVGFDQPKSLGAKETGASVALPIFIDFMTDYLKDKPNIPFRIPAGIKLVKIDAITGKPTSQPIGKDVIYEAFKSGSNTSHPSQSSNQTDESTSHDKATIGTGDIY